MMNSETQFSLRNLNSVTPSWSNFAASRAFPAQSQNSPRPAQEHVPFSNLGMASGGFGAVFSDHGRDVGYRVHTVMVCGCYRSVGAFSSQLVLARDTSRSGLGYTSLVFGPTPYGFVATGDRPVRCRKLLTLSSLSPTCEAV
jgi:hypothetical protein